MQHQESHAQEAELYNSRIIQNWLEFLAEEHPRFDPIALLDAAGIQAYQVDDPKKWFTQSQIDRFHAHIDSHIDDPQVSRLAGRFVVFKKRPNILQQFTFGFFDPLTAYMHLPRLMPKVSHGAKVTVNKLAPNRVEIINTPANGAEEKWFQCQNRLGIYEAIGKLFTHQFSEVEHSECRYRGGKVCRYMVTWPNHSHRRWATIRNFVSTIFLLICTGLLLAGQRDAALVVGIGSAFAFIGLSWMAIQKEKQTLSAIIEQQGSASRKLFKEIGVRHNTAVLIQEIGNLSSETRREDQILKTVAHAIQKRLNMDRVLLIYDNSTLQEHPILAHRGYPTDTVEYFLTAWRHRQTPTEKAMTGLFRDRTLQMFNASRRGDASQEDDAELFLTKIGAIAFVGIPIVLNDRLVGLLAADHIGVQREITTIDSRLLSGVVAQMAVQVDAVGSFRKLQASEAQYRLLADHVSDVIWQLDLEKMGFVYVSPSVEKFIGYTAEEMLSLSLEDIMAPPSLEQTYAVIAEELEHDQEPGVDPHRSRTLQMEHICKDGSRVWGEITARLLRNDAGEVVQILGVSRNISERMEAQEAQERLREQLERAKKMEALGTLAGGVAHDLNNILSGLVSYPDLLLLKLPAGSPLRGPVKTILKSGHRAAAIVQDLLTLARRGVVVTKSINLNRVVEEYLVTPEFEELCTYHHTCSVTTQLDPQLSFIEGSPVHLTKTVMNLVSNAAEAMPEGGLIEIATGHRSLETDYDGYERIHPGEYVFLKVTDPGIGIATRDRRHIFEPFYTKKIMGRSGTGLGMAVVWGTVKDHHGYIDIVSKKDRGTTFTLYFPVALTPEDARVKEASINAYVGNGESILVVDDAPEQREIAAAILTELGYQVNTVDDGEAAVAYVQSNKVDVLVLDMIMEPGFDGLDTYRQILSLHPKQKAVIATGFSETDRVLELQRLGASVCIKKPYTIETIGTAVHQALQGT